MITCRKIISEHFKLKFLLENKKKKTLFKMTFYFIDYVLSERDEVKIAIIMANVKGFTI